MSANHLVIASYDGVVTHYCGVGTIIRNTIHSLRDITKGKDVRISIAYIKADKRGKVFNERCYKESKDLVGRSGGRMIPLTNGTKGYTEEDMWKSFTEWRHTCASLTTGLSLTLDSKSKNFLMLHDTPFLPFVKYKHQLRDNLGVESYFLPHSSGMNHEFGEKSWREDRVKLEKECFNIIENDKQSFIVAEGRRFGKHLSNEYGVNLEQEKNYLTNGLYFGRYEDREKEIHYEEIQRLGIDIKRKENIIFCWGRCSVAKGLEELVTAWREVVDRLPNQYLVIQSPNNSGEDNYYKSLSHHVQSTPRTTLVNRFDPEIWRSFLRYDGTNVVCIPSIMDPNPHTAIEAKLYLSTNDYVIVASKTDGVTDTFSRDECLWVNPCNIEEFSETIINACKTDRIDRARVRELNIQSLKNYDYKAKLSAFLKNIDYI